MVIKKIRAKMDLDASPSKHSSEKVKMSHRLLLSINILLCLSASHVPDSMAEIINVPCISSQGSKGGWRYPTISKDYFPLVLIKAQIWTRGIERHPLYSPTLLGARPPVELASCAIVPADKESWDWRKISKLSLPGKSWPTTATKKIQSMRTEMRVGYI